MKKTVDTSTVNTSTVNTENTATRVNVVALVLVKKTDIGPVAYGSLVGSRHKKIPSEMLKEVYLSEFGIQFMHYRHYDSLKGKEGLILIATSDSPQLGKYKLKWRRVNKSLLVIELPKEMGCVKIPPVFGGTLVALSKTPIEEANEGWLVILHP